MNKAAYFLAVAALVPCALLAGCQTPLPSASGGAAREAVPLIVVGGAGEVMVKPDIAYVTVGVTSAAKEAATAVSQNATKTAAVLAALKRSGIAEDDLQTANYNLQADYRYTRDAQIFKGYSVSNSVRVTVRKIADTGAVLDAATQSGANRVNRVSFDISDTQKAQAEALEKAIADATAQAKAAAKAANVSRITLKTLTVGGEAGGYQPDYSSYDTLSDARLGERQRSPIQAGQQTVRVSVTARFAITGDVPTIAP